MGGKAKPAWLYNRYCAIKTRCYNPNSPSYKRYGERGIYMCDQWKKSFVAFRAWAEQTSDAESLTLDRIDNDGPYSPENCRWVSKKVQANNTSRTLFVWYKEKQVPLTEALEDLKLPLNKVRKQMLKGLELQEAFEIATLRHLFGLGNYDKL